MVLSVTLIVVAATVVAVAIHRQARSAPPASAGTSTNNRIPPDDGPGRGNQVPVHPADALDALLARRAAAVLHDDRAQWQASLDPQPKDAATRSFESGQARVFDRLEQIKPVGWSYEVAGGSGLSQARLTALGGHAWRADVQLAYQLRAGSSQVRREEYLTVVQRSGGWRIAGDTDGDTARDLWDLGPVTVDSTSRCLVIGASSRAGQVRQTAQECAGDAQRVDAVWGRSWPRRTTLTIPGTLHQLAVLLDRTDSTAGLTKTAAVTIGPADAGADGVVLNGSAFQQLSPTGRRVVLTHEMTHVATRATGARYAPTWLEEGFADYVAYLHTGLTPEQIAGDALTPVRDGHTPSDLPGTDDFNAAGAGASAAYGDAWVAVTMIAAKAGTTAALKSFYERAAASSSDQTAALNAALAQIGYHNLKTFTPLWRARLRDLAGR